MLLYESLIISNQYKHDTYIYIYIYIYIIYATDAEQKWDLRFKVYFKLVCYFNDCYLCFSPSNLGTSVPGCRVANETQPEVDVKM